MPSTTAIPDASVADRQARATERLVRLLDERPELQGVHAPADLAADAVRWCA